MEKYSTLGSCLIHAFSLVPGPVSALHKIYYQPETLGFESVPSVCVLCAKSLQSWPTLCDPTNCSLLGCSIHGISQARILEWVAMPFSRGSP